MEKLRRKIIKSLIGSILIIPFFAKSSASGIKTKDKKVDLIVVWKSKRRLTLFKNKKPIYTYIIRLGFDPKGHKLKEGDGRTPEGQYWITHKNPSSAFHKSLGISYPNKKDKLLAKKFGVSPGKDIYIHGGPKSFFKHLFFDWTEGCIAVTDSEIEEIYNIVPVNTPIYITS